MAASKEFRKSTLEMLRKMIKNPEIIIERNVTSPVYGRPFGIVRYAFIRGAGTLWSIRKGSNESTHPISVAINGEAFWGEFLDSEVESLYKDVEKEFIKRKLNPRSGRAAGSMPSSVSNKTKEKPSLSKETENRVLRFLKQHVK